jgi:hypothetical protein
MSPSSLGPESRRWPPLPLGEGWGEGTPQHRKSQWKRLRRFPRYGADQARESFGRPLLPLGESWGEGTLRHGKSQWKRLRRFPRYGADEARGSFGRPPLPWERAGVRARFGTESLSGKGCAVFHATVLTGPDSRSDGPLSPWERAGVRARLGTESSVEKAAPFSALRCHGRDRPAPPSKPDDGAVRPLDSPRGNLLSSPPRNISAPAPVGCRRGGSPCASPFGKDHGFNIDL